MRPGHGVNFLSGPPSLPNFHLIFPRLAQSWTAPWAQAPVSVLKHQRRLTQLFPLHLHRTQKSQEDPSQAHQTYIPQRYPTWANTSLCYPLSSHMSQPIPSSLTWTLPKPMRRMAWGRRCERLNTTATQKPMTPRSCAQPDASIRFDHLAWPYIPGEALSKAPGRVNSHSWVLKPIEKCYSHLSAQALRRDDTGTRLRCSSSQKAWCPSAKQPSKKRKARWHTSYAWLDLLVSRMMCMGERMSSFSFMALDTRPGASASCEVEWGGGMGWWPCWRSMMVWRVSVGSIEAISHLKEQWVRVGWVLVGLNAYVSLTIFFCGEI